MVRPKTGTYLNVFIETSIYERLMVVCDDDGQIKIVAVERALTAYLDECKEKLKKDVKKKKKTVQEELNNRVRGDLV